MIDERIIQNWFTYHRPTTDQQVVYETIRAHGREFAHIINNLVPDGPDKTTAIRTLREAVMWANAAVATAEVTPEAPYAAPVRKAGDPGPYQTSIWPASGATPVAKQTGSLDDVVGNFVAGLKTATKR